MTLIHGKSAKVKARKLDRDDKTHPHRTNTDKASSFSGDDVEIEITKQHPSIKRYDSEWPKPGTVIKAAKAKIQTRKIVRWFKGRPHQKDEAMVDRGFDAQLTDREEKQ